MKIIQKINKFISILLIFSLMFGTSLPLAIAEEVTIEETAVVETTPTPTEATQIVQESTPTPTLAPTTIPTPTKVPEAGDPNRTHSATSAFTVGVNPTPTSTPSPTNVPSGNTNVETGDAGSTANVLNEGNSNFAASGQSAALTGDNTSTSVINNGNGSDSSNNGSAILANNNNTNQNNSANVNTNLDQASSTGSNNTSYNVGANSSITTGDANTTGTVITSVNTNVDGIMVSEFNIVDDHVGDILLDFASNCVSGCGQGPQDASNSGNGAGSDNNAIIDQASTDNTFQNNDANIGSVLNLSADSGNNTASYNTGGNSSITTGDANVAANVLTFANNNVAGDVVYAVVNIFGDLIGDILFPEEFMNSCCGGSAKASNSGNGSESINNSNIGSVNEENNFQNNDANITNNLLFDASTGENSTSKNTGGDSSIMTGNTSVDANVLNIANSNIDGGNMWLVLVNEAGNWIGRILGAPADTNYAGSAGTEFNIDENGFITASNNGNGSVSTNDAGVTTSNIENTNQTNIANIDNTLNLTANTGGNNANNNTGGNSNITTGDATIVANLVNFVNNNIKGNGKLFVSVVNVFGSWFGDFVSPGQKKEAKTENNTAHSQNTGGPSSVSNTNIQSNENKNVNNTTTGSGESLLVVTPKATVNYIGYSNPLESTDSSDDENTPQQSLVKGASVDNSSVLGEATENNKIQINLAWIVLALGIGAVAIIVKKLALPKILKFKNKV